LSSPFNDDVETIQTRTTSRNESDIPVATTTTSSDFSVKNPKLSTPTKATHQLAANTPIKNRTNSSPGVSQFPYAHPYFCDSQNDVPWWQASPVPPKKKKQPTHLGQVDSRVFQRDRLVNTTVADTITNTELLWPLFACCSVPPIKVYSPDSGFEQDNYW